MTVPKIQPLQQLLSPNPTSETIDLNIHYRQSTSEFKLDSKAMQVTHSLVRGQDNGKDRDRED